MTPPHDSPAPDEFGRVLARAKKFATIAGIVGAIAGVCLSAAYLLLRENPQYRGVFTAPLAGAFGFSAMTMGIVLLFAPASFFQSEKGQEYLQMIGTRYVIVARIVILVFLLMGCGVLFALSLGILQMLGIIY